jgi:hypothetical protein
MWSHTEATGGTQADFDAWAEFEREAKDAGVYLDGGAFQGPADWRLMSTQLPGVARAEASTPGAFTLGDTQIAAYYLMKCDDMDAAVDWAKRLPTYGTVEVREVLEYDKFQQLERPSNRCARNRGTSGSRSFRTPCSDRESDFRRGSCRGRGRHLGPRDLSSSTR